MSELSDERSMAKRPGFKAIAVAILIAVMLLPMLFVSGLVEERADRAWAVRAEVGDAWGGGAQTIAGPFLTVPVELPYRTQMGDREKVDYVRQTLVLLPETLAVEGDLDVSQRYRGIYDVTVFAARLRLAGTFAPPDLPRLVGEGARIHWDEAALALHVGDNRGFKGETAALWGTEKRALEVEPGVPLAIHGEKGAHALTRSGALAGATPFEMSFTLNGSQALRFLPIGRDTTVRLSANWPHPSFKGAFLPTSREITADGFTTVWEVPALARNFPQAWLHGERDLGEAAFGVELRDPVDFYQKVARATKYSVLFFGFVFLTFFLTEVRSPARVHAVQYLLVGTSQCIFYLLLLSLAEHIGFARAYGLAAGANTALVALYGGLVLGSARAFALIAGVLLTVYGLLYSLLELEDHALLFGSLAAFLALAVTMFATRNVDWYGGKGLFAGLAGALARGEARTQQG